MATTVTPPPPQETAHTRPSAPYPLMGLLVLSLVLFCYQTGSYPLFDVDEPRYAEAAREMIESGNWITPYFNYELRFDKPIMHYWLIALSYQVFGIGEFAARLVSALAATGTVLATYWLGKRHVSERFGLYSAVILATAAQFIGLARMSITDMTLTAFMTGSTLCLFLTAHQSPRWWLGAGLFAGLAILTKGPVGIVLPGGILFLYALVSGCWKRVFLNRWFPLGCVTALSVAIPWYLLAWRENGQIFLDSLVLHNLVRYRQTVTGHDEPWWFFLAVIAGGFLPWSLYLPASIRYWAGEIRQKHRTLQADPLYQLTLFAAVWAAFTLVFFSVSGTKLMTYILPMFPALAYLTASTFLRARENPADRDLGHWLSISGGLLFFILLTAGLVFAVFAGQWLPTQTLTLVRNPLNLVVLVILIIGSGLVFRQLRRQWFDQAFLTQGITFSLMILLAMHGIVPSISALIQGDLRKYATHVGQRPLVTYEIRKPSLTFYTRRKVLHVAVDDRGALTQALAQADGNLYIITKNPFIASLQASVPEGARLKMLDRGARYSLHSLNASPQVTPQNTGP